ncbi:hypothetical protein JOD45_000934 [Scopulibacillus daqui]|uniref:Membrane protein YszA n=1 Tax=Scopulibacillus daqui TaxID=1469162 RepID=A0ABS2PXH2_9BACL|nr:hypothetical protein [Scopulibacillus daqui]MBM7644727.1 hypothetical protein [Scopulibacillus daqui]
MFNRFNMPPWLRRIRDGFEVLVLPLVCFQLLRTIFFPSAVDVIILILLISFYVCFLKDWI